MNQAQKTVITVQVSVNAPIEKVWETWNKPEDIMQWNNPTEAWCTPKVENDIRPGGKFLFVCALRDGSFNFNYTGHYNEVIPQQLITLTLNDGRSTRISFAGSLPVTITEAFDAEGSLAIDMQKDFCQSVLDSFKRYTEAGG